MTYTCPLAIFLAKDYLARRRQKLLEYATKVKANYDYSLTHFVYADINGKLKICLKKPIVNQVVFSFNNKTELAQFLGLIEYFEYHAKFGEAYKQSNCEDE